MESNVSARTKSNIISNKSLIAEFKFEILDYAIIPEIEQIFKDAGIANFSLKTHFEFLSKKTKNGRTYGTCHNHWKFSIYDDGSVLVMTCSDCQGSYECMATWQ